MLEKADLEAIQAMMQGTIERTIENVLENKMKSTIETALIPIHERLDTLDGHMDRMEGRMDNLEGRMDNLEGRMDNLEEESRQTRVLVEAQNHKIGLLCEAQVETAKKFAQLDRMEKTLEDVQSEVQVIRDIVGFHAGEIKEIKKAL